MSNTTPLIILVVAVVAIYYVWTALALQAVLRKAGEPGWHAWVPVLNTIALLRLGGFSGWWVLLGFVPVVGIALVVVLIVAFHRINIAFDYGGGMTVLAVFLYPVWLTVLGWGSAEWLGYDDPPATGVRPNDLEERLTTPLVSLPYPFDGFEPTPAALEPAWLGDAPAPAAPSAPVAPVLPPAAFAPPEPPRSPSASSPSFTSEVSERSEEVSAVADAPRLGEPRSAAGAVSALWREPADAEPPSPRAVGQESSPPDFFEETVVAARRRPLWQLIPPDGAPIALTADVVLVGRRPNADPAYPSAQVLAIVDETRTVSKTHARLERHGDLWMITDLQSTNGVFLVLEDGAELEVLPGSSQPLAERFLLGDAELRIAPAR